MIAFALFAFVTITVAACWFVGSRKASSSDYDTRIWGSGE